ncbi:MULTISPECIES: YjjG family noncanonical pyrimidine nucleotidase [Pseudothermotoga]|jgi:putative hydrolase of the HAD superfamily|uniref:HAD-superfamily hydrolase, subfamily IA, variant 1 n=1 Tax=Pseudothermotoga lettingae (strain ATCC BAA-301 / DSM 14385 / NBRC 107922 / TMO) TaxID=416591 RepID=A8F7R5_PSELT|nr:MULTISPECIES: YjjG family noncanonical pyrimidine nucleotidase [Pseudothermotoga]ABV34199.1 HAD-superfamily hydrolase, subfamily IA, variant 1 [Pseudothermotoga lettingae TMO]MDI3494471.1 putative hydrolase of the superfamily [Pseudothermotoga sp.]MDK2884805.1 putative hydrolase of the superfamily [Pseudothermotoga sp.]GLI48857.1 noncanonical pyrimidine nucleotidase, YjjG family protein [Pseudothermotoga lettingae TMO]
MKYQMVYFDLDNTLLDFSRSEKEALKLTLLEYGILINESQIELYIEINKKWWQAFSKGLYSKDYIVRARFKDFLEKIEAKRVEYSEAAEKYLKNLSNLAYFMPGAEEFLTKMKLSGQKMAVLTNGVRAVQEKRAKILKLDRFIEFILSSEQVGKPKPDPALFVEASRLSGISLSECVYIGDDPEVDFKAAKNAGTEFILLDYAGVYPDFEHNRVENFDELYLKLSM